MHFSGSIIYCPDVNYLIESYFPLPVSSPPVSVARYFCISLGMQIPSSDSHVHLTGTPKISAAGLLAWMNYKLSFRALSKMSKIILNSSHSHCLKDVRSCLFSEGIVKFWYFKNSEYKRFSYKHWISLEIIRTIERPWNREVIDLFHSNEEHLCTV